LAQEEKPPAAKAAAPPMESVPWDSELANQLKERFGGQVLECASYRGQNFLVVESETVVPAIEYLKSQAGFDYLVDITAVHWPKREEFPIDLVYHVYSFARNERLRVKTRIREGFKPQTAVFVHSTANWLEREVFDMFGIEFAGHPDLRRILLPEDWTGFPLRKDYGILQMDQAWVRQHLGIESGQ